MDYKEQLYIAAETAETEKFSYYDLFDWEVVDFSDCDGNMVTTIYTWTVANCFKLRIEFDECPFDNYQHTSMYLDDKQVLSVDHIETPTFLNSILINCIADVDTEEINVEDTL